MTDDTHIEAQEEQQKEQKTQPVKAIWLRKCWKKLLGKDVPVVAVLRLSGIILAESLLGTGKRGLSLDGLEEDIQRAFNLSKTHLKAVVLQINSPGGSPVQSELIYTRIRQYAEEKNIPVIAFVEDAAASGGYWLACAGDEIFASRNSIVGSIGVVSSGFGYVDAMKKLGVERRVHTAGESKSILDPFQPENKKDVDILMSVAKDMHDSFKEVVRERRPTIVEKDEERLFSGEFFSGLTGKELGLVDELGEMRQVMRARYGDKVKCVKVNRESNWLKRRLGMAMDGVVGAVVYQLESRSWWSRLGIG